MAEVRVDQPHCNFHLAAWFSAQGWTVLFRDEGRVSRGGKGTQGKVLWLFEAAKLPIPDIVAIKDHCLLLYEIDSVFSKAENSIATYTENSTDILALFNEAGFSNTPLTLIMTGFCRTGITKDPNTVIVVTSTLHSSVDSWAVFTAPRTPVVKISI